MCAISKFRNSHCWKSREVEISFSLAHSYSLKSIHTRHILTDFFRIRQLWVETLFFYLHINVFQFFLTTQHRGALVVKLCCLSLFVLFSYYKDSFFKVKKNCVLMIGWSLLLHDSLSEIEASSLTQLNHPPSLLFIHLLFFILYSFEEKKRKTYRRVFKSIQSRLLLSKKYKNQAITRWMNKEKVHQKFKHALNLRSCSRWMTIDSVRRE